MVAQQDLQDNVTGSVKVLESRDHYREGRIFDQSHWARHVHLCKYIAHSAGYFEEAGAMRLSRVLLVSMAVAFEFRERV